MRHLVIMLAAFTFVVSPLLAQEPEPGEKESEKKAEKQEKTGEEPRLGERQGFSRDDAPGVTFQVPEGWKAQKPSSQMRLATWRLPGKKPVDVVVYWFGKGQGGDVTANLDRWRRQIEGDEKPRVDKPEMAKGLKATVIDARGAYVAETRPGSGERRNEPDHRLLAAVIETPDGSLYLKAVGPEKTIAAARSDWDAWLKSFRIKKP